MDDAIQQTDDYYLAALDRYPVENRILASTSVVFRIHQLGRSRDTFRDMLVASRATVDAKNAKIYALLQRIDNLEWQLASLDANQI